MRAADAAALLTRALLPGSFSAMQVVVNGERMEIEEAATISALIRALDFDSGPVAVEVNRAVVPRAEHMSHRLRAGDVVEIVHFVGGG